MTAAGWIIDIDRDDIRRAGVAPLARAPLAPGEVELAVTACAITANNITYALFGKPAGLFGNDQGYWDFFSEPGGPGHLPVWGFATVTASRAEGVAEGEDYYGYFPLASHVVLAAGKAGPHGFADVSARRAALPPFYNQYQRVAALADYRPGDRAMWPIFRPLFLTGWLIADQLEEEQDRGAAQILVASASGKTALGLGFALGRRGGTRPRTVGLTSAAHAAALAAHGVYDAVVAYDAIATLDPAVASVLVDMAGSGPVTAAVHGHFGAALKASIIVGKSHWDADAGGAALPGPEREGFFAPGRAQKRVADWGPAAFAERVAGAWLDFMAVAPRLVAPDHRAGADAALAAYHEALDGRADPARGVVIAP